MLDQGRIVVQRTGQPIGLVGQQSVAGIDGEFLDGLGLGVSNLLDVYPPSEETMKVTDWAALSTRQPT